MLLRLNKFFSRLDVKLTVYYTLILLILAAILCTFFYYRLEHNLQKQADGLLRDELNEFIVEIKEEVKKGRTVLYGSQIFKDDIIKRKYFPLYFRLLNSSGEIVFQAAHAADLIFPAHKKKESFYTYNPPGSSKTFRFYEKSAVVHDKETYIFQIATEMKRAERILENFLENIFRALPVILFLSIVCGIYVSRQPRKVIRNITTVAKRMTLQNMKQRLEVPLADDEIRDLTVTINEMMNRLEKSFENMKQFTSDVSHELRNPLFALKGELEVLLSQKRDVQEYREALYECEERVDFLIKMSNDLFLISRFDENKIQMDFDYLNIDDVIYKVCDLFLPMAEEKSIKLVMNLSNGLTIFADKIKLSQVLSNLLDNAIKFTPPNGRIDLSVVRKSNDIELRVKDNGRGIPEGKTDRIFERFYQVDTSRSNQKGTGLGLQICRKIIEAHKGRIKVEKNKGEGVTFVVLIPSNV
jgi:two-component system OmpR family sensor kinase